MNYYNTTYTAETFMCYYSEHAEFIFVNSIYFYTLQPNGLEYIISNITPYGSFPLTADEYTKEKDVLLIGRPVEDDAAPIYANAEIIEAWVWLWST